MQKVYSKIYLIILTFVIIIPLFYLYLLQNINGVNPNNIYTVKPGDTLSKIALVYNIPIHQIKLSNELKSDNLFVSQKLYLSFTNPYCELEKKMISIGLVDIQSIDPMIKVDLIYSSTDNFLNTDVYGCFETGYLQKDAAIMLAKAQKNLKKQKPGYSLLICDAARPLSVQYKMWDIVGRTYKKGYVSNPKKGSMHNFGAAVDLTIIDETGVQLDMGTHVDYFGNLAQPKLERNFLAQGKLTKEQIANRKLLRSVMEKAGFKGISNEWWHFDAFPPDWVRKNLKIIP